MDKSYRTMKNNLDISGIGMTSERTRKRLAQRLADDGIRSTVVLEAITTVPRHFFIDEALGQRAYDDITLPIGYNQTLSQPYIVARMTEALLAGQQSIGRVLEIGTGSGYQTAILAQVAKEIYTIERIKPLFQQAKKRFTELRLRSIQSRYGDGSVGWQEHAPYEGIIVTAASLQIPMQLVAQLCEGGRLVIPVGNINQQSLKVITRTTRGLQEIELEPVRFVPLLEGLE